MTEEIKVGVLTKRSQQKRSIGRTNYKRRIFVLTNDWLRYYEGEGGRGNPKGEVELRTIKFIGPVEDSALNKSNTFVISYNEYFLYCIALTPGDREEWLTAIAKACRKFNNLTETYHPCLYTGKVWMCCGQPSKNEPGCQILNILNENNESSNSSGNDLYVTSVITNPALPPRNQRSVVANFDFKPREKGDLRLKQGEKYFIVDDSDAHWWKVRGYDGKEGNIPSNYVTLN